MLAHAHLTFGFDAGSDAEQECGVGGYQVPGAE